MSAYRDALTKLFLKGTFNNSEARQSQREEKPPVKSKNTLPRTRQTARHPGSDNLLSQTAAPAPLTVSAPEPVVSAPRNYDHPGKLLAEKLYAHGKTASDLARDMRVPVNRVTAIINGQRGVTADTALRFGHWFDDMPESWLDAQQRYELARARAETGGEIRRLPRLARSR